MESPQKKKTKDHQISTESPHWEVAPRQKSTVRPNSLLHTSSRNVCRRAFLLPVSFPSLSSTTVLLYVLLAPNGEGFQTRGLPRGRDVALSHEERFLRDGGSFSLVWPKVSSRAIESHLVVNRRGTRAQTPTAAKVVCQFFRVCASYICVSYSRP